MVDTNPSHLRDKEIDTNSHAERERATAMASRTRSGGLGWADQHRRPCCPWIAVAPRGGPCGLPERRLQQRLRFKGKPVHPCACAACAFVCVCVCVFVCVCVRVRSRAQSLFIRSFVPLCIRVCFVSVSLHHVVKDKQNIGNQFSPSKHVSRRRSRFPNKQTISHSNECRKPSVVLGTN